MSQVSQPACQCLGRAQHGSERQGQEGVLLGRTRELAASFLGLGPEAERQQVPAASKPHRHEKTSDGPFRSDCRLRTTIGAVGSPFLRGVIVPEPGGRLQVGTVRPPCRMGRAFRPHRDDGAARWSARRAHRCKRCDLGMRVRAQVLLLVPGPVQRQAAAFQGMSAADYQQVWHTSRQERLRQRRPGRGRPSVQMLQRARGVEGVFQEECQKQRRRLAQEVRQLVLDQNR